MQRTSWFLLAALVFPVEGIIKQFGTHPPSKGDTNTKCTCCEQMQPVPTSKPSPCSDSHIRCKEWARRGECVRNPSYMLVNCKSSCNQCEDYCEDNHRLCSSWAKRGECYENPDYMNWNCKKSCALCETSEETLPSSDTSNECKDQDEQCFAWAFRGECANNPRYMLVNCPESCDQCINLNSHEISESENKHKGKKEEKAT